MTSKIRQGFTPIVRLVFFANIALRLGCHGNHFHKRGLILRFRAQEPGGRIDAFFFAEAQVFGNPA